MMKRLSIGSMLVVVSLPIAWAGEKQVEIEICGCKVMSRMWKYSDDITIYDYSETDWNVIETVEAARDGRVPSSPESVQCILRAKACRRADDRNGAIEELSLAAQLGYCNPVRIEMDPELRIWRYEFRVGCIEVIVDDPFYDNKYLPAMSQIEANFQNWKMKNRQNSSTDEGYVRIKPDTSFFDWIVAGIKGLIRD